MRISFLLAGAALAFGMSFGTPAQAHDHGARVWVSIGDVAFSAGRPYHRHHQHPLHVVHGRHGPRYYYVPTPKYAYFPPRPHPYPYPVYGSPAHDHHHYAPPPAPPRPGYYRHRPGYYR